MRKATRCRQIRRRRQQRPRITKAAAKAAGVDFTRQIIEIIDDLSDWLETIRPGWDCEKVWEKADELGVRWVERPADAD